MARAGARPRPGSGSSKARVVAAAVETLKREGYAGTSARAVARTGGFAQGVVFYHFGGMRELLLAALDQTSAARLAHYQAAVDGVTTLPELVAVAHDVYREDLAAGHVRVLSELIAATSHMPELGPEIAQRIAPWIAFTESALQRVVDGTPVAGAVPAHDLAYAIVALYLGLELLTQLDGDTTAAESLFESAARVAHLFAPLLGALPHAGGNDG
jgi:AcrR family transcriptional regulator